MGALSEKLKPARAFLGEAVAETLWPTRCAVCDELGAVLCERCRAKLPYLDWWRACRRCGAAFGHVQCAACNPTALALIGRTCLPYAACTSATMFSGVTGGIVRTFKDQGERRLAAEMAAIMARAIPPDWPCGTVSFVPASVAAFRTRGYDHAQLLAQELARALDAPCTPLLARPHTRDQRALTSQQRVANLADRFKPLPGAPRSTHVLLVDDVYTTGATLCAATDTLLASGVCDVRCATFARV